MTESQITSMASNLKTGGEIQNIQLGIIEETPIFEVQIALNDEIHYVVINAVNGNVITEF
jgi:uncharacterized protein YpmB